MKMGAGMDAVKSEILSDFDVSNIHEGYDTDLQAKILAFSSENRHFVVRVSDEFDDDYESGQIAVDLEELGPRLRASKDGKVTVRRSGIT
jgi:hypothetical protein